MKPAPPPRIYLLAAREAPVAAILRRGPSRTWHVMRWATDTDAIESGSWFNGRIYPEKCDLSWDGKWLVYFALGRTDTWTGVCELPRLKTLAYVEGCGTYGGGGAWFEPNTVHLFDVGAKTKPVIEVDPLPFKIGKPDWRDSRVVQSAWNFVTGKEETLDPSLSNPELLHSDEERHEGFRLPDFPDLLDDKVTSALWNSQGHLLVAREGWIERYQQEDLKRGEPSFRRDLTDVPRVSRKPPPIKLLDYQPDL